MTRVGDYELVAQLASGGMAETHVARSLVDGSVAVVKLLLPRYAGNPEYIEMFVDEGRVISALHHPNVVEMRQFGFHDEVPYLAMEYLHGVDLRTLTRTLVLRRKVVMPVDVALFIASAMCAGLHHAHEARTIDGKPMDITHRDVSPQNVMLTFDGAVKLIDFGIASARGKTHETRSGALKGKIPYMAPEQVRAGVTDRRTDVYATGVVFYEMLTGRRPYVSGRGRQSEFSLMMAIVNHDVVDVDTLRTDLPPGLAQVVMTAISLAPADRFQTSDEMYRALHALGAAPAQAELAALLIDTIGPRKARAEARTTRQVIELVTEMEHAKTTVDERHDPRTVEVSELTPVASTAKVSGTYRALPPFDDLVDREPDPEPAPVDKVVSADRTRLRFQRTIPPTFRWGRLLDGIEGVVELDFTGVELAGRSLATATDALRSLGKEVSAIRLIAAPIALATHLDERCTIVSVACRGRCPACRDRVTTVIDHDVLQQRLATGAEIACPRCGGGLVEIDPEGDLEAPRATSARSDRAALPGGRATTPSATAPRPIAELPGTEAAVAGRRAPRSRGPYLALAVAAAAAISVTAWGLRGDRPAPGPVPGTAARARTWREPGRWMVELECDGRDETDAAMRCHVHALNALVAEIEEQLPPRIRALRDVSAEVATVARLDGPDTGRLGLGRVAIEFTRRAAATHAVARFVAPVETVARAVEFYGAIKTAWGIELVNAPPSRPPGVLVLVAPGAGSLVAGDRIVAAGGTALRSLDAITGELIDRRQLELIVDHQERRTLSVRSAE